MSSKIDLPPGEYTLGFAPGLLSHWGSAKKRKREDDQLIAFRYAFKPASVGRETPGTYEPDAGIGGSGQVAFDMPGGSQQVFDVREESGKARECVLVFDEESQSFTLHSLPSTLHLTLNRSSSNTKKNPSTAPGPAPPSSRPGTRSRPSATSLHEPDDDGVSIVSGDATQDGSVYGGVEEEDGRLKKKSRPPLPSASAGTSGRNSKADKSLARKKPLETAPIPVLSAPAPAKKTAKGAKGRGQAGAKSKSTKGTTSKAKKDAISTDPGGKIKSAEFIDDSDDEIAHSEAVARGEDEMDEFANLLGQSLAAGDGDEDMDDEEESEEDDEEEDALGGARLIVSGSGTANARAPAAAPVMMDDDDTEWI
ncbi:hypothetical protein IAU60_003303 [Kwoniella sp. DSM 27419]